MGNAIRHEVPDIVLIGKTADGYYMSDYKGIILSIDIVKDVCRGVIRFYKKHGDNIDQINAARQVEAMRELERQEAEAKALMQEGSRKTKGHIYLFECGGRYKVGFSDNVQRRAKQLDNRPFKLNIVAVSELLDNAYGIEQAIHEKLEKYKIYGEWYELTPDKVAQLENVIKRIGRR